MGTNPRCQVYQRKEHRDRNTKSKTTKSPPHNFKLNSNLPIVWDCSPWHGIKMLYSDRTRWAR